MREVDHSEMGVSAPRVSTRLQRPFYQTHNTFEDEGDVDESLGTGLGDEMWLHGTEYTIDSLPEDGRVSLGIYAVEHVPREYERKANQSQLGLCHDATT
jgi:hypothetical protein